MKNYREKDCIFCNDSDIVHGRLCQDCNFALGLLKEDEVRIRSLIRERCNSSVSKVI